MTFPKLAKLAKLVTVLALLVLSGLFTIAQAQTLYVVSGSASPTSGAGSELTFGVQFNSSEPGAGTWYVMYVGNGTPYVSAAHGCDISYNSGWVQNGNPAGWALVQDSGANVTYPNSDGVATNSQCAFMLAGSSYVVRNNIVTVFWHVRFTSAVNNQAMGIWVFGAIGGKCGTGSGPGCTGWQKVGNWTVSSGAGGGFAGPFYPFQAPSPVFQEYGVNVTALAPLGSIAVKWCLYWAEGPNAGLPALIPGVPISYFTYDWVAGSGGHTPHETTTTPRPSSAFPKITPESVNTDINGCSIFIATGPSFSGYFSTTAITTACNIPYLACYQDNNEVDLQVINTSYRGIPMTRFGSDPGYTFLNSADHGTNSMNGDIGLPIFEIGSFYNGIAADVGHPFTINAGSLPWGGMNDRTSTNPPGQFFTLPNSDPHLAGFSFDVYSPNGPTLKANLQLSIDNNCPLPSVGEDIFDFYTQQPVSVQQMTNGTVYLWHVYCSQVTGLPVYPN